MFNFRNFKDRAIYYAGKFPLFAQYVFKSADEIYITLINEGVLEDIRNLNPSERGMLHFTFGRYIRNRFLLWHPNNPHTMVKLGAESEDAQPASKNHPDNFSWEIIRRLLVRLEHGESKTHE